MFLDFGVPPQNAQFKSQENQGSLLGNKLFVIGRPLLDPLGDLLLIITGQSHVGTPRNDCFTS